MFDPLHMHGLKNSTGAGMGRNQLDTIANKVGEFFAIYSAQFVMRRMSYKTTAVAAPVQVLAT